MKIAKKFLKFRERYTVFCFNIHHVRNLNKSRNQKSLKFFELKHCFRRVIVISTRLVLCTSEGGRISHAG